MWVGLAAIVMLFTAFTSAYIVRKGLSDDWRPTGIPAILWINTLVLVASSVTLETARRSFSQQSHFGRWWSVTTLLGGSFLVGQVVAWRQLVGNGVYLNTNPSSSFFYLLTGTHAVHLLGGIVALMWVAWKLWGQDPAPISRTVVGVTALYWHFMDGLWIYLFLLLLFWR
jgi:cytochrome c oxidase subunit 3